MENSLQHSSPTALPVSVDEVIARVEKWLKESSKIPNDRSATRLAGVLSDPNGLDFTVGFVDGVMRPDDSSVAAKNLSELSHAIPKFLPAPMRGALRLGGVFAPVFPWIVIPIAKKVLRSMVSHLVADATPEKLTKTLSVLRASGNRLNINLLGEAVLGENEANKRLDGTRKLLSRNDVDYVSIKVSAVVSHLSMWAFDEEVERIVERLTPLYQLAAQAKTPKFINLDMEEYRDLHLTIAVFKKMLDQREFLGLEAGIVLQAYLPDALAALNDLTTWAQSRLASGGAPIKVRVVKGANLAMEHVDATVHGWPVATYTSKQASDTNYKRVLLAAFTPERTAAVRIGVAGHNLFDVAFAHELAIARGVSDAVEFEMLLGMATGQAQAVRADVGRLLLYTPVVKPQEFDVAIAYLIRRLEENASQENFMSALFDLSSKPAIFEREKNRFLRSIADLDEVVPQPSRTQNRNMASELVVAKAKRKASPKGQGTISVTDFVNEPDTDPALPANRDWGRKILARVPESRLGLDTLAACRVGDAGILDRIVDTVERSGESWGSKSGARRAAILHRAGLALAANRDRLIEVVASETGKTLAEADPEISEAIDFAHYYAERAIELDHIAGAEFVPAKVTVVTPPWNFPIAIPAGSVLSALAAGSGVIIKPAHQAKRSGAVMVEALWEAGIPRELLALVDLEDRSLGQQLVSHKKVDRVILTGAYETAQMFRKWRKDLPILAETSGKNSIIVTPSADLDLAAADVVKSAFGHAGQKCSAASLVILVGSVAKSERFRKQIVDATESINVGYPEHPKSEMGPIIENPEGKLRHALTELGIDEKWLVKPKQLDSTGRLWSPGIRTGVAAGSYFHLTEFFGPVLGVMYAEDLDDALRIQNAVDYGLTAGIHSLDPKEVSKWLDEVQAGNLYVNRGITGAIVQRQPFGGWKRSVVGAGAKAGGPNYVMSLGKWKAVVESENAPTLHLRDLPPKIRAIVEAAQPSLGFPEFAFLRQGALSDLETWRDVFSVTSDVSQLGVERNIFRYAPEAVLLRVSEDARLADAIRVVTAGVVSKSPMTVSTAIEFPQAIVTALRANGVTCQNESESQWRSRVSNDGVDVARIRLVGGNSSELSEALDGSVDVAIYDSEVTAAGRIELLPFVKEQAISLTAHRFGNPSKAMSELLSTP